ncbi:hypothetical protein ES332_A02G183100v1 [Gossypium tomentosum]|uniref:Uncharacterized protein n=1 Tax=Gossypium tomentosum TaxID=34277 RepID=A0A5D2RIV4_GOSTO|nr:hypothetical protein ES332_A02G183100v1 [Gossypium tomentosum]
MAFCHFSQLQAKYPIIRVSAPQLSSPRADSWVSPAHNVPPPPPRPKAPFFGSVSMPEGPRRRNQRCNQVRVCVGVCTGAWRGY